MWKDISSAPTNGELFLAWSRIPTYDEDAQETVIVEEPCVAQMIFGTICGVPVHYNPQGRTFVYWQEIVPPSA